MSVPLVYVDSDIYMRWRINSWKYALLRNWCNSSQRKAWEACESKETCDSWSIYYMV